MDNRKTSTNDIFRNVLYVDALAVVADSEAGLQERLVEWKAIFGRHGLWVILEKKGGALGLVAAETYKHLHGWSGLWERRHGDGNSEENTN